MSTDARWSLPPAHPLRAALDAHLHRSGSGLSDEQIAEQAMQAWLDADLAAAQLSGQKPTRGYRWKTLFLPASTELRMEGLGGPHYARVVNDQIIYRGQSVSPRGMTLEIAGEGRNAWRDLWLKFPGERQWQRAKHCRDRVPSALASLAAAGASRGAASARASAAAPSLTRDADGAGESGLPAGSGLAPQATLAAAAASMAEGLRAALALVAAVRAERKFPFERRVERHRRRRCWHMTTRITDGMGSPLREEDVATLCVTSQKKRPPK